MTDSLNDSPVYMAMDYGTKNGDFTVIGQFIRTKTGEVIIKNMFTQRTKPIRSKARIKRILKHCFPIFNGKVRPVSWQEIVAHNIKVIA